MLANIQESVHQACVERIGQNLLKRIGVLQAVEWCHARGPKKFGDLQSGIQGFTI